MMTASAFPSVSSVGDPLGEPKSAQSQGMTLRDWFAGQMAAAILGSDPSNSSPRDGNGQLCKIDQSKVKNLAHSAYQIADALMLARAAEQDKR